MLFTTLMNQVSAGASAEIIYSKDIFNLDNVAFIDGTQIEFDNNTLYFGYASFLKKNTADLNLPSQCVLVWDIDGPDSFSEKNTVPAPLWAGNTSLALVDAKELFQVFNAAKVLLDESRGRGFYGEMMDCAAHSRSMEPVINLAAAKLGNSLILLDADFKILAHSTIFTIDDPLWAENIRLGYCTYEFVSAVQEIEAVKNAARTSDPVVVTCYASPLRKLSSKIFIRGNFVGIVLMLEKETPISSMHLQLLPVISSAAGDAISRYAPYLVPGNTIYQKLLYDLLIGAPPEEIAPAIAELQFSMHLCALSIQQSRYLGQKHLKEDVARELVRIQPDTRFTFHENGIAALVPLADAPGLSLEMTEALEDLAAKEYLRIGVSNLFFRVENFAARYAQAFRALELASKLCPKEKVSFYSDYAFYDLLDSTRERERLGLYCHPALGLLSRYDHAAGTDLYHTLEIYLACNCSIKEAAQSLYIHRNSLTYRLECIRNLTHVELNNSNVRFLLEISYRIDHFIRRDS